MGFAVDPPAAFTAAFRDGGARVTRAGRFGAAPAAHLPYHGARDVCWKCGSLDRTHWRTCPATLRAATPKAAPAMGDQQLLATLIQNQQAQQRAWTHCCKPCSYSTEET